MQDAAFNQVLIKNYILQEAMKVTKKLSIRNSISLYRFSET